MHFMNMPLITTNARIVMLTLHTGSSSPGLYLYTMMPSSFRLPSSFAELNAQILLEMSLGSWETGEITDAVLECG